jgi:hypothetical protein
MVLLLVEILIAVVSPESKQYTGDNPDFTLYALHHTIASRQLTVVTGSYLMLVGDSPMVPTEPSLPAFAKV